MQHWIRIDEGERKSLKALVAWGIIERRTVRGKVEERKMKVT